MEEINNKINNLISEYEYKNKCKLRLTIYNGDKSYNGKEWEGDKILIDKQ